MFRLILALIYLLILPGVAGALLHFILRLAAIPAWLANFLLGAILGILLDRWLRRRHPHVEVFEHELTHALAALLFFRRVTDFTVTRFSGGSVSHSGGSGGRFGDDFIGLAPYVLPTFTAVLVLLQPLVPPRHYAWFILASGCTFGYHLGSTASETKRNWSGRWFASAGSGEMTRTDIARRGFFYSAISIAALTILIHGVLLAVLLNGYRGFSLWWRQAWPAIERTIVSVAALLKLSLFQLQRLLS